LCAKVLTMADITLPSGLKLQIRGLKGKVLKILQDKTSLRTGTIGERIFSACTVSVLDPGIYSFKDGPAGPVVTWDDVLLGDRFALMLAIRSATFGAAFPFKVTCRHCDESYEWQLNLTDLPVKALAPEDVAVLKAGESLTARLPSTQALVKFRLATGKDERAVAKAKTEPNAILSMLALRISEIDGVDNVRAFLDDAELADLISLLGEMDKRDCGVETTIETACEHCDRINEVGLPLGENFWGLKKG